MKALDVRKLTGEEIDIEVDRLQRKIYDLRCQVATEKIEDPSQFRKVRADVARLLTERSARIRAGGTVPKAAAGKTKAAAGAKKAPAAKTKTTTTKPKTKKATV